MHISKVAMVKTTNIKILFLLYFCKYKINLLDNFQEKILEITNRL